MTVTKSAREELKKILDNTETQPEQSLRLVEDQGYYTLVLDTEQQDDQVVEHDGTTVLLVDADIKAQLEGVVLDLQDTSEGPQLIFLPKEQEQG
ncbi:MAG: adhesin [Candidatus Bipolaricaulia bacterium]